MGFREGGGGEGIGVWRWGSVPGVLAYWIKMPIVQFRPWSALRQAVTDGWWSEIALVESALPLTEMERVR